MSDQPIFKAIAHPARREIIGLLATQQLSIGDVAAEFDMSRPAIAKHLDILESAGLITTHKSGREVLNSLNPAALKTVANWLSFYSQFWDEKLETLKTIVETENVRD